MKKSKLFIAVMLVMMLVLTACGGDADKGTEKPDGEKTSVALLIGTRGDMSFSDSAVRGVEKAEKDLGIDLTIIEYGANPDKYDSTIVEAGEGNYDMVIVSSILVDQVAKYAPEFTDTTWVIFDGEVDYDADDYSNVYSIIYSANEGAFLGGFLSASISEAGTLGFLGGTDAPIINDFLLGYIQGAQVANPDIKIAVNYAGAFNDPAKGKELSLAMNGQGADMIFNVAGGTGVGLIEAAVEKNFKVLGVDSDQAMIYDATGKKDFAEVIPTSVLKNVDNSLYRTVDLFLKGELKIGETEVLGLNELGVGIAENEYYDKYVDKDIQDKVKELQEKVQNGEIKVESVYGKTTDEITQAINSVRP